MSTKTKFLGILAVGRTKASAVNNYRLLAMGKGAAVQVDGERKIAFVTQASSADGMFNPQSGNMDLETDAASLSKLEFQSESSGDVSVNHLVCTSGCGTHVIFEADALVKFCPNCTSSLSDASEDGDDLVDGPEGSAETGDEFDAESDSGDDGDDGELDDDGDDVAEDDDDFGSDDDHVEDDSSESADEAEEDDGDDSDLSDDETDPDAEAGGDEGDDAAADDEGADEGADDEGEADPEAEEGDDAAPAKPVKKIPVDDEPLADLTDDDGDVVIAADSLSKATQMLRENLPTTSLSSGNIDAHYMRCTSKDCGAHVVSTVEVAECPACHSSLDEPEDDDAEGAGDEGEDVGGGDEDDNTLSLTDDDSGNVLDEDTEELDADAEVGDESDSADLDVSYSSSVAGAAAWTAYFKGVPVAMASKSSAGANADIFDTPKFGQAALATAKVTGVKKALRELGFTPIKHKVSVSAEVRRMVDAQVNEQRQSISADQDSFKAQFLSALATAALGINRGFFTEVTNPLKQSLWNSLNSAGIRSPEALIDNVFRSHSDAYHKVLFAQASDIVSKPKEVQESLAKAVLGTAYQAVSSAADNSIESRLETLGTSTSSAIPNSVPAAAAPAASTGPDQKRAVQSLGRRVR